MTMAILRVQATGTGRIVGWSELKQNRLVDANRWLRVGLTTTLPDVITDLLALAQSLDPACRIVTVVPNGPVTASLDVALLGTGFEIMCSRRLVRGLFPLNPLAAEFGSNYDVIVTVGAASAEVQSKVLGLLQSKYPCTPVT
jgi:hypothetical protein